MNETETDVKQEKGLPKSGIIVVERYSLTHRVHHWVHVVVMTLFCLTGFEIFLRLFVIGDYMFTRTIHFVIGIFAFFWDLVLYLFILIKDRKLGEIIVTPLDVKNMFIIFLCAIKIYPDEKYPHFNLYNATKKKYVMKYHPAQKLLALMDLFMFAIIGITGLALTNIEDAIPVVGPLIAPIFAILVIPFDILAEITIPIVEITLNTRFIHFGVFVYFAATTITHTYFALLPQNISSLKGMIIGTEKVDLSLTLDRIEH